MARIPWNGHETALLIDGYIKTKQGSKRSVIVNLLSETLRMRAINTGMHIDDKFRNVNGINMRMAEIQNLFGDGMAGMNNTSKLFRDMVAMYENDRQAFEKILREAKNMNVNEISVKDKFLAWLHTAASPSQLNGIDKSFGEIERFCLKTKVLSVPLFDTTDLTVLDKVVQTVERNKIFRVTHSKYINKIIAAAQLYYTFSQEKRLAEESEELLDKLENENPYESEEVVSPATYVVDFTTSQSFAYTQPLAFTYFGDSVGNLRNWSTLYVDIVKRLYHDYPSLVPVDQSFSSADGRIDLGSKDGMINPKHISGDLYLEGNISATGIVSKIRSLIDLCGISIDQIVIEYQCKEKFTKTGNEQSISNNFSDEIVDKYDICISPQLANLIKEKKDGVTFAFVKEDFGGYSNRALERALADSGAIKVLDKYYHKDNISDYEDMADTLLDIITRQFAANGNYTSAKQLYDEAHTRLDDFFFYNGAFDSRLEVYDLAVHLFEQEKYKGYSFIFRDRFHIWKEEPDYPMNYLGLVIKLARANNNVVTREQILDYLEFIGSTSPAATFTNMLITYGREYFLQFDENHFVLTEAVDITDDFLICLRNQIVTMLEGDDYVALGDIDDYFYTTLPKLPSYVYWSPLLLEDVLRFHDIGFITIPAGVDGDTKTVDAALVKKNSRYSTFSDIVWNEINNNYNLPETFDAAEFRQILLDKGFIRGSEKMYSIHKTVADDLRFYWTENDSKVTISKR